MTISSYAFENQGSIPSQYTCDGDGLIPPLEIVDVPEGTQSLALLMDDPDAPDGIFTHWLIWNIPPETLELGEGNIPSTAVQGTNSAGQIGYVAPCPPEGVHHYRFLLSALNKTLDLESGAVRDDFEDALKNNVIAKAELVGQYSPEIPRY